MPKPPITKAVLVGTRAELGKRSPVIRKPTTAEALRAEITSYERNHPLDMVEGGLILVVWFIALAYAGRRRW